MNYQLSPELEKLIKEEELRWLESKAKAKKKAIESIEDYLYILEYCGQGNGQICFDEESLSTKEIQEVWLSVRDKYPQWEVELDSNSPYFLWAERI